MDVDHMYGLRVCGHSFEQGKYHRHFELQGT